jgi:uncharacterized membrane protein YgaE (UPF0421/DUF939 family)
MSPTVTAGIQLSLRAGLGAVIALAIARAAHLPFPIYSMLAVVIVTDLSPERTRALAAPRLAGTLIGTILGAALSYVPLSDLLGVGIGIVSAMLISHLLRFQDATRVAGYVCGISLLNYSEQPWSYALYRMLETLLGILVATLMSFMPKLFPLRAPSNTETE